MKAITHRRQPNYHAAIQGQPPSSSNVILSLQAEAELRRLVAVPGLLNVNVCGGSSRMLEWSGHWPDFVPEVVDRVRNNWQQFGLPY